MIEKRRIPTKGEMNDKATTNTARMALIGTSSKFDKHNKFKQKIMLEVEKKIGKESRWVVDKMFELAEGVYIADTITGADGEVKVVKYYKQKPDKDILIYLLDRMLGKPTQKTEHKEERKGLLVIEGIIKSLATPQPVSPQTNGQPATITIGSNSITGDNEHLRTGEDVVQERLGDTVSDDPYAELDI